MLLVLCFRISFWLLLDFLNRAYCIASKIVLLPAPFSPVIIVIPSLNCISVFSWDLKFFRYSLFNIIFAFLPPFIGFIIICLLIVIYIFFLLIVVVIIKPSKKYEKNYKNHYNENLFIHHSIILHNHLILLSHNGFPFIILSSLSVWSLTILNIVLLVVIL